MVLHDSPLSEESDTISNHVCFPIMCLVCGLSHIPFWWLCTFAFALSMDDLERPLNVLASSNRQDKVGILTGGRGAFGS